MEPARPHTWPRSAGAALAIQHEWAGLVERDDRLGVVETVAGVDVAYDRAGDRVVAAVVVLAADDLTVVDRAVAETTGSFPYVPGLFSFRELPPIEVALRRLRVRPDLVVCDGQGYAHPRRFGLACHLGVRFDVPTIGCAKTRLIGDGPSPGGERGAWAPLVDDGEVVGATLRTRPGVRPVYVSIGHRISLGTARAWVLRLSPRYRLPETTRAADHLVRARILIPMRRHGDT